MWRGLQQRNYPIKLGSTMVLRNGKHLPSKGRGLCTSSCIVAAPLKKNGSPEQSIVPFDGGETAELGPVLGVRDWRATQDGWDGEGRGEAGLPLRSWAQLPASMRSCPGRFGPAARTLCPRDCATFLLAGPLLRTERNRGEEPPARWSGGCVPLWKGSGLTCLRL